MGKILIITTHYNNPGFIELQLNSFKQFIKHDFEYVVVDDSSEDTISLVTQQHITKGITGSEIKKEADRLDLKYIKVPQSIHASISNGGLVPDGLPVHHPTERHRACLHWVLKNYESFCDDFDLVLLTESDVFIKKDINLYDYIGDLDLIGTGRRTKVVKSGDPNQYWMKEISHLNELDINFFTMYLLMWNPHMVINIDQLDIGGFAGTDTGGKTHFFLDRNSEYSYEFIEIGQDRDHQVDFFSKNKDFNEHSAEFIHYRGGSNWDYQSLDYYNEKLNRMLKEFIPSLYKKQPTHIKNLTSRDGEHTFHAK